MTKFESEMWYLFCGILMGLRWAPISETTYWWIGVGVLLAWMILRDVIGGKQKGA